jgi:formiminotetrahydrofolate cyclodeaminase
MAVNKNTDPKGEFLAELIERRNYWASRPEAEAKDFAEAYERLIAAFTMPKSEDKS